MPLLSCPVPADISILTSSGFLFEIQKYPEVTYYTQDVQLPTISLGTSLQASSVHDLKIPGDTMDFEDISVQFLVDAKMENYLAIHDWITGLGFPEGHEMYRKLMTNPRNVNSSNDSMRMVSDCSLIVLDNNNKPLKKFNFIDAFPTQLSGLSFTSTSDTTINMIATMTLSYSYYTVS